MSAQTNGVVLVKVTLTRNPEQRDKAGGGQYTLAKGREGAGEGARFWSIFAFTEAARAELNRLDAGDVVTVQGEFGATIWKGRGKADVSLKINADRAVALRPPPRTRKPRANRARGRAQLVGRACGADKGGRA